MAKTKPGFYAVKHGKVPGVYMSWDDCQEQVKGFPGAIFKKFDSKNDAENYIKSTGSSSASSLSAEHGDSDSRSIAIKQALETQTSPSKGKKRSFNDMQIPNVDPEASVGDLEVYSDGACKGNGNKGSFAGIGVWWGHDDPRNLAERCPGDQTNNRAELYAICRVLETTSFRRSSLTIWTDSKYCINCFDKWLPNWMKNDWRRSNNTPPLNLALIRYIASLLHARFRIGQKVFLKYVKGHSGNEGNDGADLLANQGAILPAEDEKDWDSLRLAYEEKVEKLIEARRLHVAEKHQEGTLEIIGAEEAANDLQEDYETEPEKAAKPSNHKVQRTGEVSGADVKNSFKQPVVPSVFSRKYSAGVAEPSPEELKSLAQDLQEEESGTIADRSNPPNPQQLFSAQVGTLDEKDLQGYADAWDDNYDLSE